jgi:ABC-type lipoprotein export system ATPase subunit
VIRLVDLWRTYDVGGRPLHALREIDEEIASGEHVAIMGPSGSGKSTLLNLIGCLDRPTQGSYTLDGREVAELSESELADVRRNLIGFVFQSFHLVPRLTSTGNVELPMMFAGWPRGERLAKARAALDSVGMGERADHRPDQLSGGERQRVAIARALAMDPSVLLADEPTGNLDSKSGGQVLELLGRLNDRGITLVVVTHDPGVARRADRVITLVDGRIVSRVRGEEMGAVNPYIAAAEDAEETRKAGAGDEFTREDSVAATQRGPEAPGEGRS